MQQHEAVFFAIGCLSALTFLLCVLGACVCGRDSNWQESFERSDRIAYVDTDDRWHAGRRLGIRYDKTGWWNIIRGRTEIQTKSGTRRFVPHHEVIEIENIFRPTNLQHFMPRYHSPSDLEDGSRPVVGNLMRAYTPMWSFTINAVIVSLSTAVGFEIRISSDVSPFEGFVIIFGTTFIAYLLIMSAFFYLFGFGEAMLAPRRPKVLSTELSRQLFGKRISIEPGEAIVVTESNQIYGPRLLFNFVSKIYLEESGLKIDPPKNLATHYP